jgi:enediyne biosynthesis protein E3
VLLRVIKSIKRSVLSVDPREVELRKRGFHVSSIENQTRLESIGQSFLKGYHLFLKDDDIESSVKSLATEQPNYRGFCIEGAAMAIWLLDALSMFNRSRWDAFYDLVSPTQPYMGASRFLVS